MVRLITFLLRRFRFIRTAIFFIWSLFLEEVILKIWHGGLSPFLHMLWSIFLNGLLTILPITVTVGLFGFTIRLLIAWLAPLHNLIATTRLGLIPYAEVLIAIGIIFAVGAVLKFLLLQPLIHTLERLFFKIPLVRPIYSGTKQLVHAFGAQDKASFKRVVLVEFPRPGVYSLGFLTSDLSPSMTTFKNGKFYNIFIPTTPNPTSGYYVIVPEQEIIFVDLTRQEAMAMVISGGIIQPDRFSQVSK